MKLNKEEIKEFKNFYKNWSYLNEYNRINYYRYLLNPYPFLKFPEPILPRNYKTQYVMDNMDFHWIPEENRVDEELCKKIWNWDLNQSLLNMYCNGYKKDKTSILDKDHIRVVIRLSSIETTWEMTNILIEKFPGWKRSMRFNINEGNKLREAIIPLFRSPEEKNIFIYNSIICFTMKIPEEYYIFRKTMWSLRDEGFLVDHIDETNLCEIDYKPLSYLA